MTDRVARGWRMAAAGLWLFVAGMILSSLGPPAACAAEGSAAPLVVTTQQGRVLGVGTFGVHLFAGVRYAAPPVGNLRWRPPGPPPVHANIANATQFGSRCPQAGGSNLRPEEGGNEDCLFLNIYTPPNTSATLRPVMVYIHGGSFVSGSGELYVPISMVLGGNVEVVTINYRLGPLGALALPQLDAENPKLGSGAYSLLDQQQAVRWVQANIAAFGGDPHNITLFGESAGATYVCQNVASPLSAGLLSGAIAESGCGLQSPSLASAETLGEAIATRLRCVTNGTPNLACMRRRTPLQITLAAIAATGSPQNEEFASVPATGGGVLPHSVFHAFATGATQSVPLLLGSNQHEGRFFVYGNGAGPIPTNNATYLADLATFVTPNTGAPVAAVAAEYPITGYSTPAEAYAAVVGDGLFACRTLKSDDLAMRHVAVYGYQFSDPKAPNALGIPLGATHTSDLYYLFDLPAALSPKQVVLGEQMKAYWTNFAHVQNPSSIGLPNWSTVGGTSPPSVQTLIPQAIAPLPASTFAYQHHCGFWAPYTQ